MQIERYPISVTLEKKREMIYFSQLDLVHILERALRRSGLPLYFTMGYNPRVKISFTGGLKLGIAGRVEATLYFSENVKKSEVVERLQNQLPTDLIVLK